MSLQDLGKSIRTSLEQAKLIPGAADHLIPKDFQPTVELSVSFGDRPLQLGNLYRAGECRAAPSVGFGTEADQQKDASYLLLLVDPDAPTPDDPKFAFWRHWVFSGLRPSGDAAGQAATKAALTEYHPPGPKDDSGPHRYLFLLFREPPGLSISKEDVGSEEFVQRRSFDPAAFAQQNNLSLVALNWMRAVGDGWQE